MKKHRNDNQTPETGGAEREANAELPAEASAVPVSKVKKAFNIVLDVVLYLFLALSVFLLILTLSSRRNDGAVNFFGKEMRIVVSSSMEMSEDEEFNKTIQQYKIKDLKVRTMVFIKRVPDADKNPEKAKAFYDSLKVGDVLTFRYTYGSTQETITHRIIEITPTANGYRIRLQGDNRAKGQTPDVQTVYTSEKDYDSTNDYYNYVIGKVTGKSAVLGNIVYAVSRPVGIALIVIVPCSVIIIWQIVRIVLVIAEDRKKKAAEEQAKKEAAAAEELERTRKQAEKEAYEREQKERELEELRRKVAELENASGGKKQDDAQE